MLLQELVIFFLWFVYTVEMLLNILKYAHAGREHTCGMAVASYMEYISFGRTYCPLSRIGQAALLTFALPHMPVS